MSYVKIRVTPSDRTNAPMILILPAERCPDLSLETVSRFVPVDIVNRDAQVETSPPFASFEEAHAFKFIALSPA